MTRENTCTNMWGGFTSTDAWRSWTQSLRYFCYSCWIFCLTHTHFRITWHRSSPFSPSWGQSLLWWSCWAWCWPSHSLESSGRRTTGKRLGDRNSFLASNYVKMIFHVYVFQADAILARQTSHGGLMVSASPDRILNVSAAPSEAGYTNTSLWNILLHRSVGFKFLDEEKVKRQLNLDFVQL